MWWCMVLLHATKPPSPPNTPPTLEPPMINHQEVPARSDDTPLDHVSPATLPSGARIPLPLAPTHHPQVLASDTKRSELLKEQEALETRIQEIEEAEAEAEAEGGEADVASDDDEEGLWEVLVVVVACILVVVVVTCIQSATDCDQEL